ncbi:MAG TPA: hypothetical protein VKW08_06400 [Xanthobacteraceae bacterium]|nr:hypothetical protein [Xanthobacteraceae bacterium]
MRTPSWIFVTAAVIVAFPFGWRLGLVLASLIAGRDFGQLPVLTVIIGLAASIAFAVAPILTPGIRLTIMLLGTAIFVLAAYAF